MVNIFVNNFMPENFGSPWDDYHKWLKWAYEARYGQGSWYGKKSEDIRLPVGLIPYEPELKKYWNSSSIYLSQHIFFVI
jgi:hypothetical protein